MVQLRHINRNGVKLQRFMGSLYQAEKQKRKAEEQQLTFSSEVKRVMTDGFSQLVKKTIYELGKYDGALFERESPCNQCPVKEYCKCSGNRRYMVSERNCSRVRNFVARRLGK